MNEYDSVVLAIEKATKTAPLDDWSAFAKVTGLKVAALKKVRPFITEKDPKAKPVDDEPDVDLRDTENIPFTYDGGIDAFMKNEVLTYAPDAWIDEKKTQVGYEIRFTRYFKPKRNSVDIAMLVDRIRSLQKKMTLDFFLTNTDGYDAYMAVDEIWIHDIPSHWETVKIKRLFNERIEKGYPDEPLLAATQNMGVVHKTVYGQRTVEATKDLGLLKLVRKGDFVISLRSFQGGIELAHHQGIISPAYTILIPKGITTQYFKHLAKSPAFIELLKQCVTGIREGQNIDYSKLRGVMIPVPPVEEQLKIASYLDSIDARIDARTKEISLLRKYKNSISSDIVTGKIDVRHIEIPEYEFIDEDVTADSDENGEDTEEQED